MPQTFEERMKAQGVPDFAAEDEKKFSVPEEAKLEWKKADALADTLVKTPDIGMAEQALGAYTPPELRELVADSVRKKLAAQQPSKKKLGDTARLGVSVARGMVGTQVPRAKWLGALPSLDPDQEQFANELVNIRQSEDPLQQPGGGILGALKRGMQSTGEMTMPMLDMMGTAAQGGLVGGAVAKGFGLGTAGTAAAVVAGEKLGTTAAGIPQIADQLHRELILEGHDPQRAWWTTLFVAPIESAIESLQVFPFRGAPGVFRGKAMQVARKVLLEFGKRYAPELAEEGLQAGWREVGKEVARALDEEIPNKGLGSVVSESWKAVVDSALPLALMLAPGGARLAAQGGMDLAQRGAKMKELQAQRTEVQRPLKEPIPPEDVRTWAEQPENAAAVEKLLKIDKPSRQDWIDAGLSPADGTLVRQPFVETLRQVVKEKEDAQQVKETTQDDVGGGPRMAPEVLQGAESEGGQGVRPGGQVTGEVPAQVTPAPEVPVAKSPWEMTRAEFVTARAANADIESDEYTAFHLSKVATGEPGLSVEGDKIVFRNDAGEPIGVTTMRTAAGEKVIDSTAVRPDSRRKGVATSLYEKAAELGYTAGWVENRASASAKHKMAVKQAIAEGKPIPAEVLAEYPDLAPAPAKALPVSKTAAERAFADTTDEVLLPLAKDLGIKATDRAGILAEMETIPSLKAYIEQNLEVKEKAPEPTPPPKVGVKGVTKPAAKYTTKELQKDLETAFVAKPGVVKVEPLADGLQITLPGGGKIKAQSQGGIKPNVEKAAKDYGTTKEKMEQRLKRSRVAGATVPAGVTVEFKDGTSKTYDELTVLFDPDVADKRTAFHEPWHVAMDFGFHETPMGKRIRTSLLKKYGSDEGIANARGEWVGPDGLLAKIRAFLQQIFDPIHRALGKMNPELAMAKTFTEKFWSQEDYRNPQLFPGTSEAGPLTPAGGIAYQIADVKRTKLEVQGRGLPATVGADKAGSFEGLKQWLYSELASLSDMVDPKSAWHKPKNGQSLIEYGRRYFSQRGIDALKKTFKGDKPPAWVEDKKLWQDIKDDLRIAEKISKGQYEGEIRATWAQRFLSTNVKTSGFSWDFALMTCMPTERCSVCYAKGQATNEINTCKARLRHTIVTAIYPETVGRAIGQWVAALPKGTMPVFRINGAGDSTFRWQIKAINAAIEVLNRPVVIFSRSHISRSRDSGSLADISNGHYDPKNPAGGCVVYKMGSVDKQLREEYGDDFLRENLEKRGIINSYLVGAEEDAAIVRDMREKGIELILHTNVTNSIVQALDDAELLATSDRPDSMIVTPACTCALESGPKTDGCATCVMSQGPCFAWGTQIAMTPKGKLYTFAELASGKRKTPKEKLVPMAQIGLPEGEEREQINREVIAGAWEKAAAKTRSDITAALRLGKNINMYNPRTRERTATLKPTEANAKAARKITYDWDAYAEKLRAGQGMEDQVQQDWEITQGTAATDRAVEKFTGRTPAGPSYQIKPEAESWHDTATGLASKAVDIHSEIDLPDLYQQVKEQHPQLTVEEFKKGMLELRDQGKIRLLEYTRAPADVVDNPATIQVPPSRTLPYGALLYHVRAGTKAVPSYQIKPGEDPTAHLHADGREGHSGPVFKTGQPVTFYFRRNKESATGLFGKPKKGDRYDRDKEPSGEYMVSASEPKVWPHEKTIVAGEKTFQNPLVIKSGGGYGDPTNWKNELSKAFGGLTGKRLSRAVVSAGYDGIVTVNSKYDIGEILDLTTFDYDKAMYQIQPGESMADAIRREYLGQQTTGTKHAKTDELRAAAGLGERVKPEREHFEDWEKEAAKRIKDDPNYPEKLAERLIENPEPIDKIENAALGQYIQGLKNRHDAGEDVLADLAKAVEASVKGGSEAGRALVSRRGERYSDFSLAGIIDQRVKALGDAPSGAELAKYAEMAAKIEKLEAQIKEQEQAQVQAEIDRRIEEDKKGKKQPPKEKVGTKKERLQKQASEAVASFKSVWASVMGEAPLYQIKPGEKEIGGPFYQVLPGDQIPAAERSKIAQAAADVVKAYTELGVESFLEFKASVKRDIGTLTAAQSEIFQEEWDKAVKSTESPLGEEPTDSMIGAMARQLTRWAVESGITDREEVIDVVHAELTRMGVEQSRSDTMRAMSGYGEFRELPMDTVSVAVRGIKGEIQQLLKLEAMQAGEAPEKTGVERREPTETERQLIKDVNEAKKKGGYVVTDPKRQLKSAIQTAKTAAENAITDTDLAIKALEDAIANKTPLAKPEERTSGPTDPDLDALKEKLAQLRARRKELRADYEKIFPKKRGILSDALRLSMAERMLKRLNDELEADIAAGRLGPKEKKAPLTSQTLVDEKQRREALQAALKAAREASPEYLAKEAIRQNARYKRSLERREVFWQKRLDEAQQGILPKKRKPTPVDLEILEKKYQIEKIKREATAEIEEVVRSKRGKVGKMLGFGGDLLDLSIAIQTGFEMSATLRQGLMYFTGFPIRASRALRNSILAAFSRRADFALHDDLMKRANNLDYMVGKLETTADSGPLSSREELIRSRLASALIKTEHWALSPARWAAEGLLGSERAFRSFGNTMRADLFDYQKAIVEANRPGTWSEEDAKIIGHSSNVFSGRAPLQHSVALGRVFWAPRWVWSRALLLVGQPAWKGDKATRLAVGKVYVRAALGIASFQLIKYALYSLLAGDDDDKPKYEWNPISADFAKTRLGETRLDSGAGLNQLITFAARMASGYTKKSTGEIVPIRGEDVPFGGTDARDIIHNLLDSKLASLPAMVIDFAVGENIVGEKATIGKLARDRLSPMTWRDIWEAEKELGIPQGTVAAIEAFFGTGVTTYGPRTKYREAGAEDRQKQLDSFLKKMKWDSPPPAYSESLLPEQLDKVEDRRQEVQSKVLYSGLATAPDRKEAKNDDTYQQSVKEHEAAVATLAELAKTIPYETAQELLRAREDSWVHKDGKKTRQFTEGYKKKSAALKKIYGR